MSADPRVLALLEQGELEVLGRLPSGSNETFLVRVSDGEDSAPAVYKPELGEAPLRDFPPGLHRRERAAYLLSEALGWDLVPETVLRGEDAPFGVGSLQRFVPHDPEEHYFTLLLGDEGEGEVDAEVEQVLRRLAVFDVLANNADRKGGHVLRGTDGHLWGIDHGLCFAAPMKLRTVIWDFAGEPLAEEHREAAGALVDAVPEEVAALLAPEETVAIRRRALGLFAAGRLPVDETGMRVPWPFI